MERAKTPLIIVLTSELQQNDKVFKQGIVSELMNMKAIVTVVCIFMSMIRLASALTINSVTADTLLPGQEGKIRLEIENTLNKDVIDVSLILQFNTIPLTPIGSSEQSVDEIREDDEETFVFGLKAETDIKPGDYEIPYTLSYEIEGKEKSRQGSIGIKVRAHPDLAFSVTTENPVEDQQGSINLKVINKGFSDARFVSVRALADGFTLLSDDEVYIGSVDSDDFETATFDVVFKTRDASFNALVEYTDFDNKRIIKTLTLPFRVYSKEEAVELGIIKRDNTFVYIGIVIMLVLLWIFVRMIRKRRRLKRSMNSERK